GIDTGAGADGVQCDSTHHVLTGPVPARRDRRCRTERMQAAPQVEDVAAGTDLRRSRDQDDAAHRILAGPVGTVEDRRGAAHWVEAGVEVHDVAPAAIATQHEAARHVLAGPVARVPKRRRAAACLQATPTVEGGSAARTP